MKSAFRQALHRSSRSQMFLQNRPSLKLLEISQENTCVEVSFQQSCRSRPRPRTQAQEETLTGQKQSNLKNVSIINQNAKRIRQTLGALFFQDALILQGNIRNYALPWLIGSLIKTSLKLQVKQTQSPVIKKLSNI